ncbi:tetratricopeptide repeat protein 29 isoform X1 [Astyanax mexicanus]|uniref:tetratricopeptide repeat protein 29 isoform X1 n=1 Tax=Astyanax mexicanus TaxID=7994 RepID=UPI000BBDC174|nr:tetratricopeptide repeat protein 29 isoform X1 [Astyanax mexicanus]
MFLRQKSGFDPDLHQRPASSNTCLVEKVKHADLSCPEVEKRLTITVSECDIARFRNPLYQNLCVSMLQEGFHLSFEKFFSLLKRSRASRLPLEDQHHKLEMLREHLTRAEGAERAGQYEVVCDGYSALAGFFSGSGDEWLQEFFFHLGFFSSCRIKSDGGRREAEARAHLGHLHLKRGELDQALEHYGKYQCLVAGQPWRDEGGRSYQSRGEEGLCRIYFLLSEKHLQNNENQRAAEILTNAYYITKQGDDRRMEGEAAFRLAVANQSLRNHTTAKQFLNRFVEISTALGDSDSLGKAYKAYAKSLESEGKQNESLQYLQKYADISQEKNQEQNLLDSCMSLGYVFSSRGEFDAAWECFMRVMERGGAGSVEAQAAAGAARGFTLLPEFSATITNTTNNQSEPPHTPLLHQHTPHDKKEGGSDRS